MNGASDRIDPGKIQFGNVCNGRVRRKLGAGGIERAKFHGFPRCDPDGGLIGIVPAEMALVLVDCIAMVLVHETWMSSSGRPRFAGPAGSGVIGRPLRKYSRSSREYGWD